MDPNSEKLESSPTKNLIVDVAEKLFSKFGYLGVSMSDIAKSLEMTKAALYYHFPSKEKLYLEVIDGAFSEFSGMIKKISEGDFSVQKKFCKAITSYVDFCLEEKDLAKLTNEKYAKEDENIVDFISRKKDEIAGQFEPIVKDVLVLRKKDSISSNMATHLLIGMLNTFVLGEILDGGKNLKSKDIAKHINSLFFK
ncbi:MAG: TetR/AcrR family transcriptional regulator [Candidatus Paceibacterota bacterium]|jgi:TetR/AcrR family transcriptional regulator